MEKGIQDLFQQKLYRPIDNFNLEYCQNKNKVFLYNEYDNYANEVQKGMKELRKKKLLWLV